MYKYIHNKPDLLTIQIFALQLFQLRVTESGTNGINCDDLIFSMK